MLIKQEDQLVIKPEDRLVIKPEVRPLAHHTQAQQEVNMEAALLLVDTQLVEVQRAPAE